MLCVKIAGNVANSVDQDETPRSAASHFGRHCLPSPVCPNTYDECGSIPTPWLTKLFSWNPKTSDHRPCAVFFTDRLILYTIVPTDLLSTFSDEVNLQNFSIIACKSMCRNYLYAERFYSSHWL